MQKQELIAFLEKAREHIADRYYDQWYNSHTMSSWENSWHNEQTKKWDNDFNEIISQIEKE